jgi:hypothetical protein
MAVIKHLLRYVTGTLDYGLFYPRGNGGGFGVPGYSDLAGDTDDSKIMLGIIFFLSNYPLT